MDESRRSDDAFRRLVEPHRAELHAHCYRMLGSLEDADDALQDALLRAWRGLAGFEAGRPLRPWLYRIATNVCLDAIAKRPRHTVPGDDAETVALEPYPDELLGLEQRESVELAFIAALQHLPARQRAALILRDVLGFSAREAADALQTTTSAVDSALRRARKASETRLPARSQQDTIAALGDERLRALVGRYVAAWQSRDIEALVALLVEDARFAMPPLPGRWRGRDAVIAFIVGTGRPDLRHVLTQANGQPAVAWYERDRAAGTYRPVTLEVLGIERDRVRDITAFVLPELFSRFGLPAELAPGTS